MNSIPKGQISDNLINSFYPRYKICCTGHPHPVYGPCEGMHAYTDCATVYTAFQRTWGCHPYSPVGIKVLSIPKVKAWELPGTTSSATTGKVFTTHWNYADVNLVPEETWFSLKITYPKRLPMPDLLWEVLTYNSVSSRNDFSHHLPWRYSLREPSCHTLSHQATECCPCNTQHIPVSQYVNQLSVPLWPTSLQHAAQSCHHTSVSCQLPCQSHPPTNWTMLNAAQSCHHTSVSCQLPCQSHPPTNWTMLNAAQLCHHTSVSCQLLSVSPTHQLNTTPATCSTQQCHKASMSCHFPCHPPANQVLLLQHAVHSNHHHSSVSCQLPCQCHPPVKHMLPLQHAAHDSVTIHLLAASSSVTHQPNTCCLCNMQHTIVSPFIC